MTNTPTAAAGLDDALRASEERFRMLVETSISGVVLLDQQGHMLYSNPAFQRIIGYSNEEIRDRHFAMVFHPEELESATHVFERILQHPNQTAEFSTFRMIHKDGSMVLVEGAALMLPDGTIVSYNRDVTQQKRAEAELLRLNAELEHRVAERAAELEATQIEQRRLAAIVEATSDYVGIADLEGWSLYVNEAGRRMIGKTDEDYAKPWHVSRCHPASEQEKLSGMFQTCLKGETWMGETKIVTISGREIPVSVVCAPLRDADGKVEAAAAIMRDISERKGIEAELQQAKEAAETALADQKRLIAVIEATSDLVALVDLQGTGIYLNRAGRRLVGIGDEVDVRQMNLMDFYPPHAIAKMQREHIPQAMKDGVWTGENVILNGKGEEVPISQAGLVLFDEHGAPEFLATIARDISERKEFETQLQQAKEAAEAANRAKSSFLANMSHEIRTPMNAIIGMTSLLLDMPLDEKQHEFVDIIRSSSDSLLTIINDILDFSKIEAQKLEIVHRPFDLRDCIESALDLLSSRAGEKNLDLVYVMEQDVPITIVSDVTRLRQILVNLLSNAVKFTDEGEVVLTVSSTPPTDGGGAHTIRFSVRDTGIGIPPNKMDRLFKSFSQIDTSTTREYGGTGLGLAISKRLAEMMGGTMWAESDGMPGHGAIFTFTISAAGIATPLRTHLHTPQPHLRGKSVLIVDDNPTNRRILSLQVQTWGMLPREAASPTETLKLLNAGATFDVAILDMHMPEMDGQTLAAVIRREHGQAMPMILYTSLSQHQGSDDFFAHLTKPVKPSELFNVLVRLFDEQGVLATQTAAPAVVDDTPLAQRIPLHILLAEDVVVNQKYAVQALARMGYRVDVVANGMEAVEAMQRQDYEVILMDVQMPEMDGLEATRQIRRLGVRQPHIIAMTANAMQGDREICLEAGMDDYISKPVYIHELRAALERAGEVVYGKKGAETPSRMPANMPADMPDEKQAAASAAASVMEPDAELIAAFIEEAPTVLDRLFKAVKLGDAKAVRSAAHQLKGSAAYVGAETLRGLCADLERQAAAGDLTGAQAAVERIDTDLAGALVHLTRRLPKSS